MENDDISKLRGEIE